MRMSIVSMALLMAASSAFGMPIGSVPDGALTRVQLRCDHNSCTNMRTGEFTMSGCDWRGCYPTSGPVGRRGVYGEGYYERRHAPRGYGDGYYGRRGRGWYDD